MAYRELLAERVRVALAAKEPYEEKKMFGDVAFLIRGKMVCGIVKDDLLVRVTELRYQAALAGPHCREMNFTGRLMKGFLFVVPEGVDSDKALDAWLDMAVEYVRQLPREEPKNKNKI